MNDKPEYINIPKEEFKAKTLNKGLYVIHLLGLICGACGVGMVWAFLSQHYITGVILAILFMGFLPPLRVDKYGALWGHKK